MRRNFARQDSFARPLFAALLVTLCASGLTAETDERDWASTDGLYVIRYESEVSPLAINRLHRWTLTLTDRDGLPVESARFEVTGGMPEHNHGLPTEPEVTRYLGAGRYLLEGMRFHMQGYWELTLAIDSPQGRDTVILELDIDR